MRGISAEEQALRGGSMATDERFWRSRERVIEGRAIPQDGGYVLARIDGRAFHTLTRGYEKPFDLRITTAMEQAAKSAANAIPGCAVAYWQSDEISLAFPFHRSRKPTEDSLCGIPFGGRAEKIASVLASAAAVGFDRSLRNDDVTPTFDCRVFVADDGSQLREYLEWRIADSRKNAISTAAWAEFGHSKLLNVSTAERRRMLIGTQHESLPDSYVFGNVMAKLPSEERISWVDKRDGSTHEADVTRHRWTVMPATTDNVEVALATFVREDG
jgi:tRNA(His) 5'-end guanylyltransferase